MKVDELIEESLGTLAVNKMRTGLAMLGVVIGIGSVIALMSLGQASQKSITSQIQALGTNLLTIMPESVSSGGVRSSSAMETLTLADAEALETDSSITSVAAVAPVISSNAQVIAGRNNTNTQVYGVTPEYMQVNNVEMAAGSFISDRQVSGLSRVAVLGPETVTELFGEGANAVGQMVRINGQVFTVVGITVSKGGSGIVSQDRMIYVPLSSAEKVLFGKNYLSSISVSAKDEKVIGLAQEQITALLLRRHKINDPSVADFRIMSQEDLLGTVSQVTGTFTALLSGIAAISLVVGGIGIMNIMLVTVTERTREIGLRKALGAKKKLIIYQFLLETVLITLIGGLIGVALGIGVFWGLIQVMGLSFSVSVPAVGLAFGVSAVIGLVFGWYPAQKAANLQPIEALRYE